MNKKSTYNPARIFGNVLWAMLGMGTVVLLGAAMSIKNNMRCKGVEITIRGVQNNFFIDKKEVKDIIENINAGKLEGRSIAQLNLAQMETVLQKNKWIKKAELFFDNNEVLRIDVTEREPVARIFTKNGTSSFYIDTARMRLPLSDKFSARVPVFTGFPSENGLLSKQDSVLLSEIKNISNYVLNNPFWMAQIDQIDITDSRTFEMIPKVGNQIIVFGSAENYQQKFDNLLTFYKQVQTKVGWNKYSRINVQYKNQVVAVKRGEHDVVEDSLRAKQIMQTMIANALKQTNDSITNIQLVQIPDDNSIPVSISTEVLPGEQTSPDKPANTIIEKDKIPSLNNNLQPPIKSTSPVVKTITQKPKANSQATLKIKTPVKSSQSFEKPNPNPLKKTILKSNTEKSKIKIKPKAVMPSKNEY